MREVEEEEEEDKDKGVMADPLSPMSQLVRDLDAFKITSPPVMGRESSSVIANDNERVEQVTVTVKETASKAFNRK